MTTRPACFWRMTPQRAIMLSALFVRLKGAMVTITVSRWSSKRPGIVIFAIPFQGVDRS